jgi:polyisoprenoid-binding protein YceI
MCLRHFDVPSSQMGRVWHRLKAVTNCAYGKEKNLKEEPTMTAATGQLTQGLPLTQGRWTLDPHHSAVAFTIRHLGLSRVRGRFERFDATLDVGATINDVRVAAQVEMASVNTGQPDRDNHLRATDFFNVEQHPELRFVSTALSGSGDAWQMTGEVTLNGHTHPLTLAVEFNGAEVHPGDGKLHAGFSATGTLKRSKFGIEFGLLPLGGDRLALGDDVKLEIEIQFYAPDAA